MDYATGSSQDTENVGKALARSMSGGETVLLTGVLGAGKSTFTRGFIHYFIPHVRVLSPTFTIVRHYPIAGKGIEHVIHADCYRLSGKDSIETIGLSEWINNPKSLVLIEWPQRLKKFRAGHPVHIDILISGTDMRRIHVERTVQE